MKLYHYSEDLYPILKTRSAVGGLTPADIKEAKETAEYRHAPGLYVDHISFFFDPIPLKLLGSIYGKENTTWFNGNVLNEYIVDVTTLENDILFHIVESPESVALVDSTTDENWEDDSFKRTFFKTKYDLQIRLGEIGNGRVKLEKQIIKYHNQTEHYYRLASKRSDFKENITKYAANVPHVMMYPKSGTVKIESVNIVTIGNDTRKQIKLAQESLIVPVWSKW